MGAWSVILPEAGTNKVLNPIALGASYFTAIGAGAVTAVTSFSYFGYKCYRIVTSADNTGAYFTLSALANAIHYMTMRVHTNSDITPLFDCSLDNSNWTEPTLLFTEGDWWVYGIQFSAAQANASTAFRIQQKGTGANDIYIGHIQVEENTYYTTPITGSRKGFCDDGYVWNGAAHGASSTRAAKERSGGKVVDLETTYNFRVLYGQGAGMPPIQHHVQEMALLPGSLYQGSKVMPRVLDLYSGTMVNTAATVSAARKNFINAVKPDRVNPPQPVVFWYTAPNTNKPVEFRGVYDSGMEFQTTSGVIDKPTARFICYDPFAYETHTQGQIMLISGPITDADYIVRKTAGTWENISTSFNSTVYALARGTNGVIYIGGNFTDVVSAAGDYMLQWNPYTEALAVMGTGTSGIVRSLCPTADGNIYAGGLFATADGTTVNNIARWNIAAADWYALTGASGTGTSAGSTVMAIVPGHDGNVYIGGTFALAGGIANTVCIAYWDGSEFYPLGTGMNDPVYAIAIASNGDVYATGYFTTAGGVSAVSIAKWDGSAWSALGTGLTGGSAYGYTLAFDKAGYLYVGGDFTAADGVACANIAKWNGKTFEPLGSGLNGVCYRIAIDDNGVLYASGAFTTAGGLSCDRLAVWNGYTWAHLDLDLPGSPTAYAILPVGDDLYIGYSTAGGGGSSGVLSVTNNSTATSYPTVKFNRSTDGTYAYVWYLKNNTTGATIWLDYSLVKSETLTLDFTPGNRSITSDAFGDVWHAVLRGSDLAEFFLQPGVNSISAMVATDATCICYMEWDLTHWSADMVAA